ncbi:MULTISPECIES: glutamate-5-semialdehyde dehydrogenase [unclassified Eubacterium (in: firmicutes)]|jgi:glutamate-5-semialdehyde dehydrogenase|uniref:glutamate-5-semialdehyde dehydrogenase n=1 Tax=Eubacterium TaxID=1730 RepID=UPI000E46826F|nr:MULTISPECIES: glutamate-5-semialdehyde dehydrogenase [unclassified Eubacterium (in: firmicutes)]RGF51821.1 glutamate-5-semialdehyde dehydrogenase [Eubacterium sp. AF36-5BH]RHP20528.1 glutamate-5-semialdehyde dehydrogenase [Eubacterium sp. AF34-35BH]
MNIKEEAKAVKLASPKMAGTSEEARNKALLEVVKQLKARRQEIFEANAMDLKQAEIDKVAAPIIKRLKFDETKLRDVIAGIEDLVKLEDPLFKQDMHRQLDEGLTLYRETCPIGVIGVIFEARPDALIQISSLCIKSGNCVILKGGSETMNSNRVLFNIIYEAVIKSGMPENCMLQLEARSEITDLLTCNESVDLLIPRGSNAFVQYIMNNTKIPVMGHADGICHIYVDKEADFKKAIPIIIDAKTQYVSACNSVETLLIHKDIVDEFVPKLYEALKENNVELRGTEEIVKLTGCNQGTEEDNRKEYLDYIVSAKVINSLDEAIEHINYFGSHHTDCIITENSETANEFMRYVDSAGVYQNCSTRFADGYRYGFGAEVGISTSKIHARGPVGLEGLVSYKYKLFGNGNVVDDYAKGKKQFHFKDL